MECACKLINLFKRSQARFMNQIILTGQDARRIATKAVLEAPDGYLVEIKPQNRTSEQNRLLWALLSDISRQVDWYGKKLSCDAWKHVFTAAWKKQESVPGIEGGFVVLGQSTSKLTKSEFADLCEIILAFGAAQNVRWTDEQG